ncbi:rhodanese-like domain-containing protein [Chitinimonas sp. BJB300]|uniref:rhodanese-like domain-containing protein n=1 Tax=Chitinimonas sp. BJB300 TaxID=1559339 RepID=UPI000C0FFD2B|nr:rhodanese-like domain-containing protein [Chitinimonas sp. BJB300]PHV11401.1 rhodanese [Chitinimonas sp. BJB300]TSJ90999.1 rhodanese-like domain-containing protein [Chitinimonas sp. BJB300]
MSQQNEILQRAHDRAEQMSLPYSGALTPDEAHALIATMPNARLVDVRTHAEWQFVGTPEKAIKVEWKSWPGMTPNPNFLEQLKHQVDAEHALFFLCRTGARSHEAAVMAAAHGFSECYNILEGFEGEPNEAGQRGQTNGWKGRGLPWSQS